jgi:hypothetical protein
VDPATFTRSVYGSTALTIPSEKRGRTILSEVEGLRISDKISLSIIQRFN